VSRTPSWRKILAVPAALSLALGGALLGAAPASAAPADLTVTSPETGAVLESRSVTFTGTGTESSTISVVDGDGVALPGTASVVVTGGLWSIPATFAEDAAVDQSVTVTQTTAGAPDGSEPVSFQLPAVEEDPEPIAFEITSPIDTATLTSRTVVFTGTGADDSVVTLVDGNGAALPGTAPVTVTDGAWTTTATYANSATVAQKVTATQTTGEVETGEQTISLTLPAVEPEPEPEPEIEFVITSPEDESVLDSLTVVFTGTGTSGSTVDLLDIDGEPIAGATGIAIVDGEWTVTVTFPEGSDPFQVITAVETTGTETREAYVFFELPYEYLPAPVITSPTNGETVVGDQVTFTGTGEPGANVLLGVIPTSELEELEDAIADEADAASGDLSRAAEPADPEDPIVVGEDGTWSVTLALVPEDYTVAAALIDPEEGLILSDISEFVEFSLVAAVAAADPTDPTQPGDGLAVTGSESTGVIGLAAALLLAGGILLAVRSRVERSTQD
jgi:hypothetical protein